MSITNLNAPMTALVEYQVRTDKTTVDEWLKEWQKRAQDALEAESQTTTYASAVSLEDESCLFFYEHYENGRAGLESHLQRPSHAALNETMGARRMTKRRIMGTGFFDLPNFGWRGRDGGALVSVCALFEISGLRFDSEAQRCEAIRLLREHLKHNFSQEPGTLIVSGGIATQDSDRGPDIKKGDLILIVVSFDRAAMETHRLRLNERIIYAGIEVKSSFKKMYRTTGHGFLLKDVCRC